MLFLAAILVTVAYLTVTRRDTTEHVLAHQPDASA
jgi:hypothetical protein